MKPQSEIVGQIARTAILANALVNGTDIAEVEEFLKQQAKDRLFEILVVTDLQGNVTFAADPGDKLVGTTFNPEQIVTLLAEDSLYRNELSHGFVSFDILNRSSAPVFRSTGVDYYSVSNPIELKARGYMRFAAAPVLHPWTGDMIAAVVSGYLLSGKGKVAQTAFNLLDNEGFVSAFYRENGHWKLVQSVQDIESNYLIGDLAFKNDNFLNQVSRKEASKEFQVEGQEFELSGIPVWNKARVSSSGIESRPMDEAQLVLIRGSPRGPMISIFQSLWVVNVIIVICSICASLLWTLLLINWFIDPLETLVEFVKSKMFAHYQNALKNVQSGRKMGLTGSVGALIASSFLFAMLGYNMTRFNGAYDVFSSIGAETRLSELGYMDKLGRLASAMNSYSEKLAIVRVLQKMNSEEFIRRVKKDLAFFQDFFHVELAVLISANQTVELANVPGIARGSFFELDGHIQRVLKTKRSMQVPVIVPFETLSSWQTKRWLDSPFANSDQQNDAVDVSPESLVLRTRIIPVGNGDKPAGALVVGDLINGKARVASLTVKDYGNGYEAMYLYDKSKHDFVLLTSTLLETPGGQVQYNIALPSKKILYEALQKMERVYQRNVKIGRVKMDLGAYRVPPATEFIDQETGVPMLSLDLPIFGVRGQLNKDWTSTLRSQTAIQASLTCFHLIATLGIAFYVFKPIWMFTKGLTDERYRRRKAEKKAAVATTGKPSVPSTHDQTTRQEIKGGDESIARLASPRGERAHARVKSVDYMNIQEGAAI